MLEVDEWQDEPRETLADGMWTVLWNVSERGKYDEKLPERSW